MQETAQNEINIAKVTQNRVNLIELLKGYESINKFSSLCNRIKKSSNKKTIALVYITVVFFFIAIICVFTAKNLEVLYIPFLMYLIALAITGLTLMNNQQRDEVINCRYNDVCELLRAKGINSENIKDVIEYFTVPSEPVSGVVKQSSVLESIIQFTLKQVGLPVTYLFQKNFGFEFYKIFILFILLGIILIILILKFCTKDTYTPKIRKLVRDLKKIDSLNSMEVL